MLFLTEETFIKSKSVMSLLRKTIKKVGLFSFTSYLLPPLSPLKAVELQPDDALSLQYHGEVLSTLGRKVEARQQFMEATCVEVT